MKDTTQIVIPGQLSRLDIMRQAEFCKALRLLAVDRIREIMIENNLPIIGMSNDDILGVAHRCRLKLITANQEEKAASESWLRFRGMM